jgi:glycine/D-amino acid oxidase-like deaminating enzyme
MPAFVWQRHADGYFYGTPDFGDGVKVASDVGRPVRDPDRRNRGSGVRERRLVEAFVTKRLPRVRGSFVRSSNCLYTNTPDHDFLLDFHPDHSNVIVVSACSGHGFKFLPALGEAVATMARTGSLAPRWEGFALARFSGRRRRGNV